MEQHYLSYIEVGGHAALMLSFQEDINKPVQIVYEVGFGFAPNITLDEVSLFSLYKGQVREEQNASRALYSNASVRHKTYPISKEELSRFFFIVNEDKKKNLSEVSFKETMLDRSTREKTILVGGDNYQKIRHNCKVYALNVFKRIGIVEAKSLENTFIQEPGSTPALLESLTNEQLFCPVKDNFKQDFMLTLTQTEKDLSHLLAEKNNILFESDPSLKEQIEKHEKEKTDDVSADFYYHAQFFRMIQEAKKLCIELRQSSHKAGIDPFFQKNFIRFYNLVSTIETVKKTSTKISTTPNLKKKTFESILYSMNKHADKIFKLYDSLNEIKTAYHTDTLEILWKTPPKLSQRIHLDTFNDTEKAIYVVTAKTNEIIDGLALLSNLLSKELNKKTTQEDTLFSEDLLEMKRLIEEAQQELHTDHAHFAALFQNKNPSVCKQACADQFSIINRVTHDLEKTLSNFKPRSPNSAWFVNFFVQLINLFKQEPYIKDFNAGKILSKQVSSLQEKNKKHDLDLNPTFSRKRKRASSSADEPINPTHQKRKIASFHKRPDN